VSANKTCPQCGKNNLEGKRFCVECGARLDKSVAPVGGKETPSTDQVGQEARQQVIFSHQDVIGLLQQIVDSNTSEDERALQEQRIARLVQMGQTAVPATVGAIWSTIRYGDHEPSRLQRAGLLCEAIGRMGGEKAFDALARFATHESTVAGYAHVRAGALRGLGCLDDRRAEPVIAVALEDPDVVIRDAAAWALKRVRSSSAVPLSEGGVPRVIEEVAAPDQPDKAPTVESVSSPDEVTIAAEVGSAASDNSMEKKGRSIAWLGIAGAVVYVGLIVLVFFVPQIPFGIATLMLLPGVLGLILARGGGSSFFDRHPAGCMWMLASVVGGLILYGLLWLFQRPFFLGALESF